ncbi:hypothetical protein BDV93DRAFT_585909 [Ceratobasidium sp. AG-I]|nr:hypothetical protein BDV93DRAFT_585909 [Ceratobasidium sp. AG-I]
MYSPNQGEPEEYASHSQLKPTPTVPSQADYFPSKPKSRLYALTIGINNYPSLGHLGGAVNDANNIVAFLTEDLNVPIDHILNLRNESATRCTIIKALQDLRGDSRIEKGDPILIYYAGHGGSTKASNEWREKTGSSQIQVIFPWDYHTLQHNSVERVDCIPDRTIHLLLNSLAEAKGNNIASSQTTLMPHHISQLISVDRPSGTRIITDKAIPGQVVRYATVMSEIPYTIDRDVLGHCGASITKATRLRYPQLPLNKDQMSHVHLAACGSKELAREDEQRGVFTTALLQTIRACGADLLTYQNLMIKLPSLPNQTPHCYGKHKSRTLFTALVPSSKPNFIPVTRVHESWILQAGASSGVTPGSIWELHVKPTEDSSPIATLRACLPQTSSTLLESEEGRNLPSLSMAEEGRLFARHILMGEGNELKVYFNPGMSSLMLDGYRSYNPIVDAEKECDHGESKKMGYTIHHNPDEADLTVDLLDDYSGLGHPQTWAVFTLYNPQVQAYAASLLESRSLANFHVVQQHISVISRWSWQLKRTNVALRSEPVLSMEFMKLGEFNGDVFQSAQYPLENLNQLGAVEIQARPQDEYGIRLINHSPIPLYAQVFYFDVSSFSITNMFGNTAANGRADPEIPARGHRLVGDGSDGGASIAFGLEKGRTVEVGFIKVFWSTDPLELNDLEQGGLGSPTPRVKSPRKFISKKQTDCVKDWGTLLVTLVQRA